MLEINKESVSSIKKCIKKQEQRAKLVPEHKNWLGCKINEYVYTILQRFSREEFLELFGEENYIDDSDNKIYYYPYILIDMNSGECYKKFFKTEMELDEWYNKNLAHLNLLEI